ncbi:flavin reductase family protein [Rhodococcus sp. DMU1]|uniref:flavin reductase family protein n=1 Tax=Rhodococcus sp. DMU1 TaxID=2722825 RepID=UPI00143E98E0|nr:flavin reductase family protein [Rhodococcus sp. DMU1]QIX53555.1 flavin reductase family protein [Rhodococcus sp. DMU1]
MTADLTASPAFREAMARFPSGVTIVTTVDEEGRQRGFTASSFCSVSMDPQLVLVCLATGAECHDGFERADTWLIHIAGMEHEAIVRRFAIRGADKFAGNDFTPHASGLPHLADAPVVLECRAHARYPGGDHTILVGEVVSVGLGDRAPVVYYDRTFTPARVAGRN